MLDSEKQYTLGMHSSTVATSELSPVSAGIRGGSRGAVHTLSGQFASFWQANGGLALFGYPISEPFTETGADGTARTVQYFERYRFEYYAETDTVELGRLGVQIAQAHGYLPAA